MSNLAINIRLLFWHYQITFDGKRTFKLNPYRIEKEQWKSIVFPIAFYDFKPWLIKC